MGRNTYFQVKKSFDLKVDIFELISLYRVSQNVPLVFLETLGNVVDLTTNPL